MADNIILREVDKAYEIPVRILSDRAGFRVITMLRRDETPIQSKGAWLRQGIAASCHLLARLGSVRRADQLLLIGNYMSLFAVFLNKIHLIHPEKMYWWGFQIRSEKVQKFLRRVLGVLYSNKLKFIVFSKYERELYAKSLGLDENCFISIPYGDWHDTEEDDAAVKSGDYYFAGGYSNRDYAGLLKAWKKTDRKLVIIGSENNRDLYEYTLHPDDPNVEVLLDTEPAVFQGKLAGCKACIFPFTGNTGASGQTVALRCMKSGKLIISQSIDAMKEYVIDGETGFLIDDMEELPGVIEIIEQEHDKCASMLAAQEELFRRRYSYDVIADELVKVFK